METGTGAEPKAGGFGRSPFARAVGGALSTNFGAAAASEGGTGTGVCVWEAGGRKADAVARATDAGGRRTRRRGEW